MKWIFAFIGFYINRFPGALLGFFIGSLAEQFQRGKPKSSLFESTVRSFKPGDFELHLLMLSATVIKADGKIKTEELQFVRNFFIAQYGELRAQEVFKIFNREIKKEVKNITTIAGNFLSTTRYETRLQILHFLFGIANADGQVSSLEENKIVQIAIALGLRRSDIESIKAMFIQVTDNAYTILEITSNATDLEVKTAYRNMAKKYHPDKIQSKDPAMVKGAKEKFQEVQKAYEAIQKERGL